MVESSKIKRLREKLGLSQEKLARLADVSNNTIINIEAGKQQNPTVDTIKKIAKALNVPIEDLIKKFYGNNAINFMAYKNSSRGS